MVKPKLSEKEFISFRLRKGLKQKLTQLAEVTGRSQTFLAEEALEAYCDLQEWQITAIKRGIEASNEGRVMTTEQVIAELEKRRDIRL